MRRLARFRKKLRASRSGSMGATEYKHVVLGPIFLEYICTRFAIHGKKNDRGSDLLRRQTRRMDFAILESMRKRI